MGLLPEGEANLTRLLGIVEKSQVTAMVVILVVILMLVVSGAVVVLVVLAVMTDGGDVGGVGGGVGGVNGGVGGVDQGLTQGRLLGLKEQWAEHR